MCRGRGDVAARAAGAPRVELVADAGHELRGPLCAARLGLHGLDDLERAAAVDLELRRAALAVDDLVAAGRGRRAGARSELVDVGALLDDGVEAWRPLAAAFGAALGVEPLRGRALVRADPVRLAQACGNLVANAVEHGGSPVRVRGRVVAGRVRVEVSDAGPGLPGPVTELVGRRRGAGAGRGLASPPASPSRTEAASPPPRARGSAPGARAPERRRGARGRAVPGLAAGAAHARTRSAPPRPGRSGAGRGGPDPSPSGHSGRGRDQRR